MQARINESLRIEGRILLVDYSPQLSNGILLGKRASSSIEATLTSPSGRRIWYNGNIVKDARIDVTEREQGTYTLCFSAHIRTNKHALVDLVYFTVMHVDPASATVAQKRTATAGAGAALDTAANPDDSAAASTTATHEHLTQLHDGITRMSELLAVVKGEQKYFKRRCALFFLP